MLVPPSFWQNTVFLCQDDDEGRRVPRGTAFFVSVTEGALNSPYVVTAAHNIQFARAAGRPLYLRLNRHDGQNDDIELPDHDVWLESPVTDLAVTPFPVPVLEYELTVLLASRQFASEDVVKAKTIGPGDEVFFCGLFTGHPGRSRSQPIVRWGNVSMMPGEPVRIGTPGGGTREIDAYLVEARSWGGQSGSPAFVFFPPDRQLGYLQMAGFDMEGGTGLALEDGPLLLGIVQGHFDIEQDVTFASDLENQGARVNLNAGIAVVIPVQRLIDLLEDEDLVRDRKVDAKEAGEVGRIVTSDWKGRAARPSES